MTVRRVVIDFDDHPFGEPDCVDLELLDQDVHGVGLTNPFLAQEVSERLLNLGAGSRWWVGNGFK